MPKNDLSLSSSATAARCFLTEAELANRWGLSPKTLARWRGLGTGPVFARFGKVIRYPIDNQNGVLDYEQGLLRCSTTQRAMP